MNSLHKVLVVDDGNRPAADALSLELAELGFASVTASLEAAEDVLGVIDPPSAIFMRMPRRQSADYPSFVAMADQLRARLGEKGAPVILWEGSAAGGISSVLARELGPQVLSRADL